LKATITHLGQTFEVDLSKPIDISIPLSAQVNPVAWYIDAPKIEAVEQDDWVGNVAKGGDVNFNTITFNPHAHGTHTETVGHITAEAYSINEYLKQFFFLAELITVAPEQRGDDKVISLKQIEYLLHGKNPEAVVIRTIPNTKDKKTRQWSHSHWPYIEEAAMVYFRESGIKHLLIDLPSVDPEKDGGALKAHRAFWNVDHRIRKNATITEMIYIPHKVKDGRYLLNLQIAAFDNDAAPSKPILYSLKS